MKDVSTISLESEAGFRVLFECATISIVVINQNGVIELLNPCAERMFGYQRAELTGKQIEMLIPRDRRKEHVGHRDGYFARPKSRPMGAGLELHAQRKNGEVFPVEVSLGHYELQGEKLAVAFVTDITVPVAAKKMMFEREAWFRNMADNSPVMIWVSGTDKLCNYFNNTWLEFTGKKIENELGAGWIAGVHPDDVEECMANYSNAFDDREQFLMEYRLRRHDGHYRWIRDFGKPTFTTDNIFTGYIGSCTDVHDQRMMQEELEAMVTQRTNELSAALNREKDISELKSRFVSMASHEFRTPLSIVLSSTSLIEQYTASYNDEKIKKFINRIKSSVTDLTSILNDFLSLDKLEQGDVVVEQDRFDLTDFISEMVQNTGAIQKKGQKIEISFDGKEEILIDKRKLGYILTNLFTNAVKYSPEDSVITVNGINDGKSLAIFVKDRGIGIPIEEQSSLFTKFFRAHNTANIQGTGLGLTIVKRYVELMGGTISFVSAINEGSTFYLSFPVTEP